MGEGWAATKSQMGRGRSLPAGGERGMGRSLMAGEGWAGTKSLVGRQWSW